jgi:hypothetical protein
MAERSESEIVKSEEKHAQRLARELVEEVWNLGANSTVLGVEYEGADWEVSVKVKHTEEWAADRGSGNS